MKRGQGVSGGVGRGVGACLLGWAAVGCLPEGQRPATPDDVPASDAHVDQITEGAALFAQRCAGCHGVSGLGDGETGAPALVGPEALAYSPPADSELRTLTFWTAADLFHFVRGNMPIDRPGSLSAAEHWAVIAFVLHENGLDLRGQEVTLENAWSFGLHP